MIYFTNNENAEFYECGFSCDNAILLRVNSERYFMTDSRYTTEAKEAIGSKAEVIESGDLIAELSGLLKKLKIKEIVFNDEEISLSMYQALLAQNDGVVFKPESNFHQKLRIIKSPEEVRLIKQSQKLAKDAYKRFAKYLNKKLASGELGMNERFLHFKASSYLTNKGELELSFDPILGINGNAAKPHALPSADTSLQVGDTILLDAGVKYLRYCSDRTRTAVMSEHGIDFGKEQTFAKPEYQKIYDTVLKAHDVAIEKLRAGMSGQEIDAISRDIITKAGYGDKFVHNLGHGTGLDIHELPHVSRNAKGENIVDEGMVFSIEPGIYLPGEFGVRIEDLVVLKNGRAEVL